MYIFNILKDEKNLIDICKELNKYYDDVNISYSLHKYTNGKVYLIEIFKVDKNQTYTERILCYGETLTPTHEYAVLLNKIINKYLRKIKLERICKE